MATQFPFRFLSALILSALLTSRLPAMEDPNMAPPAKGAPKAAEYRQVGENAYPKSALIESRPSAIIIPQGKYEERDGAWFFTPKIRAPQELFFEKSSDWIEPITPPDMPASLSIAPDAMQIREPQGDVEIALPSAPANFTPATANMTVPNGAVIKTGPNSTAAVLFGGVDSARLMPNSAAAVQQTVTPESRSAEVDLTTGGVFSKIGTQLGVAGTYAVHTPFGNASAQGGDFATILAPDHVDVWVAAGRVRLDDANGTKLGETASDGAGELKLLRAPSTADARDALADSVNSFTTALNFIPLANQKLKALRERQAQGLTLTTNEQAYLHRIRQVPYLIMLDLAPPAMPAPAPQPLVTAPSISAPPPPTPTTPPAPPKPAVPLRPITLYVHADGTVRLHGHNLEMSHFQDTLKKISQTRPQQPFIISAKSDIPQDKVLAVQAALTAANFQNVTTRIAPAPPAHAPAAPATTAAVPVAPVASPAEAGSASAADTASSQSDADALKPRLTAPTIGSAERIVPLEIDLHPHGKIVMEGEPVASLDALKSRLAGVARAIPNQPVVLRRDQTVSRAEAKKVLALCRELNLKATSLPVVSTAPPPDSQPTASSASEADNTLPSPEPILHPAMQLSTGDLPAAPSKPAPTPGP